MLRGPQARAQAAAHTNQPHITFSAKTKTMTNTLCDQISTQMHACACGCIVLAGYIEFGILDSNILDIIAHVLESGCMCLSTG